MKCDLYDNAREAGGVAGKALYVYGGRSADAYRAERRREVAKAKGITTPSYRYSGDMTFAFRPAEVLPTANVLANLLQHSTVKSFFLDSCSSTRYIASYQKVASYEILDHWLCVPAADALGHGSLPSGVLAFLYPQVELNFGSSSEEDRGHDRFGFPWTLGPSRVPNQSVEALTHSLPGFSWPSSEQPAQTQEAVFPTRIDSRLILRTLLEKAESKAFSNDSLKEEAEALSSALRDRPALSEPLLEMIARREGHQRVRWLATEVLAREPAPPKGLVPVLLEGLAHWDDSAETLTLLGAAVAFNLMPVPREHHEPIRNVLQRRLERIVPSQLDATRTAMTCQFVSTLGSYAEPADLSLLARFWGRGAGCSLRLAALDAVKRVVRCFPAEPRTDEFFSREAQALVRQAASSLDMPETTEVGAIFHATICLLAARLGPEARALVDLARNDRSRSRQLARALVTAARNLTQAGQEPWCKARQAESDTWRQEIEAIRVSPDGECDRQTMRTAVREV